MQSSLPMNAPQSQFRPWWRGGLLLVLICSAISKIGLRGNAASAEDTMPETIPIVCRFSGGRGWGECKGVPVENSPVPNLSYSPNFREQNGTVHAVTAISFYARAVPELIPKQFFFVNSHVKRLDKINGLKEGQFVPLCGHVYRFTRDGNNGLLTLLRDHPLEYNPTVKSRFISVSGSCSWMVGDRDPRGSIDVESINYAENGGVGVERFLSEPGTEECAIISITVGRPERGTIPLDECLKYKLRKSDECPKCRIIKMGDHIKTDNFDFVVRQIIPSDNKENPGWVGLELLTGKPVP